LESGWVRVWHAIHVQVCQGLAFNPTQPDPIAPLGCMTLNRKRQKGGIPSHYFVARGFKACSSLQSFLGLAPTYRESSSLTTLPKTWSTRPLNFLDFDLCSMKTF